MNIKITKKAKNIINNLSEKEKEVYNIGIEYIKQDLEHINKCELEISIGHQTPEIYHKAISNAMKLSFRVIYLLQCLNLSVNCMDQTIEVKSSEE